MSQQVQRLFNGIAPRYDTLNHLLSAGRDKAWRKTAAKLSDLKQPASILDLCGGTGDFLRSVLDGLGQPNSNPIGVIGDFSVPMLQGSRGKFHPEANRVHRAAVDALHLPFKPESFDAVFCGYGMRNLDNWRQGLEAIQTILKPGGVFVTLEFFKPETLFTRLFYGALAPLAIPFIGGMLSRKEAYAYLVKSIQEFSSVAEYAQSCRMHGFDKVSVTACDFGITHIVKAVKFRKLGVKP